MKQMTVDEWTAFLRVGTRTAKLGLVLPSGRPSVTPVWFLFEDDGILRFETGTQSPKAAALRADNRVSIAVDLEEPPYGFVRVDGTARLIEDSSEVLRVATAVGARYMGVDRAEEFGRRNGGPGQIVVEVTPSKVTAVRDVAA